MMRWAWTCRCCGKQFDTLPLDFGYEAPFQYGGTEAGGRLTPDLCEQGDDRFVRGCLEIPIIGMGELFIYGTWSSLSQASYARVIETWNDPDANGESFFGWFCNRLPETLYPDTLNLKCRVHLRGPDLRPYFELEPTDHPLAVEQRNGITIERVIEIVSVMMPRH